MTQPLFLQNIIACIWDFDKTLSPGYMQAPIFELYKVDSKKFWKEVDELPAYYKKNGLDLISTDTLYLNHLLTYTRQGTFKGLNNERLRKLGGKIELYEGLPNFFDQIKNFPATNSEYAQHEIQVEHYIVSTGLRQMILGSKIAAHVHRLVLRIVTLVQNNTRPKRSNPINRKNRDSFWQSYKPYSCHVSALFLL